MSASIYRRPRANVILTVTSLVRRSWKHITFPPAYVILHLPNAMLASRSTVTDPIYFIGIALKDLITYSELLGTLPWLLVLEPASAEC